MTPPPVPAPSDVAGIKSSLLWFLAVASLVAILVVAIFAWIDSRKLPTIAFNSEPQTTIVVDIRGAISTPGVVYLEPGDRLIDVVNEAGGLAPDADRTLVNMSARVNDGQVILIPTLTPIGTFEQDGLININTASVEELNELPGIGEVLAMRIVAYREANGPFQTVDDLDDVEGISVNLVETLRPHVSVSGDD